MDAALSADRRHEGARQMSKLTELLSGLDEWRANKDGDSSTYFSISTDEYDLLRSALRGAPFVPCVSCGSETCSKEQRCLQGRQAPSTAGGQDATLWSEPRWNGREWYRVGLSTGACGPPATTNAAPQAPDTARIGGSMEAAATDSAHAISEPAAAAPSEPDDWIYGLALAVTADKRCNNHIGLRLAAEIIRLKEEQSK